MSETAAAQATYEALHQSIGRRQPRHIWVVWESVDEINDDIPGEPLREDLEAAAQAAIKASPELAKLRGQIEAVRAIAEFDAPERGREQFASPKALLARAILDQLGK